MEIDLYHRQALALAGHCQMKKAGYLPILAAALSPPRLIPLTLSNTRSLPSNHHQFLNNTFKQGVVATSLDLQKLSTLQFVEVLLLVAILQPEDQPPTQLWGDAAHDAMRVVARGKMTAMILGMAFKFSWRNRSQGGKGNAKELLRASLLGARKGAKEDRYWVSFSYCIW
jgi:hypothetical protein